MEITINAYYITRSRRRCAVVQFQAQAMHRWTVSPIRARRLRVRPHDPAIRQPVLLEVQEAKNLLHLLSMIPTPRTDAVVEMRRHDANSPAIWCTDDVIEIIKHARRLECELAKTPCSWKRWESGQYETSCDNVFEFTHDGIKENSAVYCQFCGGLIVEIPHQNES